MSRAPPQTVSSLLPIDVVVVGGSAGSIDPLSLLLSVVQPDFRIPVVIVLHRPTEDLSSLRQVLERDCPAPVREVQDKEPVLPGSVYLAPPDYHLLFERDRTFALSVDEPVHFSRPSIDVAFESAAAVYGSGAAAVILSGANSDGAAGLLAVHQACGLAIVQSPAEATVSVMPTAALKCCPHAHALGVIEIQSLLLELNSGLFRRGLH